MAMMGRLSKPRRRLEARKTVGHKMVEFGFHCSHEQHSPADLLGYVKLAQEAGFEGAMCSDHFHLWSERQGQSGFAWSWLGSALEGTNLSFGTVSAPGQRYHLAIIAQAAATLEQMYPGRFWLAVGSGEALNESITGERWPDKAARDTRLRESVNVIRALWSGETVSHEGTVKVRKSSTLFLAGIPSPSVWGGPDYRNRGLDGNCLRRFDNRWRFP
jgi:G6PDH family F420-dependent oxidoreductase